MFQPIKQLEEAVAQRDIRKVRTAINSYLLLGRIDETEAAVDYAESRLGNVVWEGHDNRSFSAKREWNADYLGLLVAQLKNNFSKERYEHILEVDGFVYGAFEQDNLNKVEQVRNEKNSEATPLITYQKKSSNRQLIIMLVILGVAVVLLLVLYNLKK